jgi:glycosyltransferase involved in cell wall biosynthesis
VEAQACGTPVIAFGRGGAAETIRGLRDPQPTGVFFGEQTVDSIISAVEEFEGNEGLFTSAICRMNAERFSKQRFKAEYGEYVSSLWRQFKSTQ